MPLGPDRAADRRGEAAPGCGPPAPDVSACDRP
jgi:hypothetical protein